jgi:hydrogenase maturation protein HypF
MQLRRGRGLDGLVTRQRIRVVGRVQGVGFRPAVYRLAHKLGLTGTVFNDPAGVTIELQGEETQIDEFLVRLHSRPDKPPLAEILSCLRVDITPVEGETDFVIRGSQSAGTASSHVTADIATCGDCLRELRDSHDPRYRYPFINCTNCGPRYSLIKTIPYDRPNTTMSDFAMCPLCRGQYTDVADRRFHAQPVACPVCGPQTQLTDPKGSVLKTGTDETLAETVRLLRAGRIVAIKGVGGFHLAVDALNNEAVLRLRQRKGREHKPFALMADSVDKIRRYAEVSEAAEKSLIDPRAPIVLLPRRKDSPIAPAVAPQVSTFGFMLCYAPLHYLLFAEGLDVLVMTSANISDEPLICRNDVALQRLGDVADAFLMHNREIYRQVDDSIVHLIAGEPVPLRRARGYVPSPIIMEQPARQQVLATGADLKNTFCLAKDDQLILSEHIGDLENAEVYRHYVSSIEHFRKLFEVNPTVVACDLHPGYFSTQYAQSLTGVRIVQVQHHWAHIASVLAEHGQNGKVIGIECDGTGLGTDGAVWGCECMVASLRSFERVGHLDYYPLAGADKASKEPIRPALALLKQAFAGEFDLNRFAWLLERLGDNAHEVAGPILTQIDRQVNVVPTSSLGRVFDAVAALLGLGTYNHFDAELPMALESAAAPGVEDHYAFDLIEQGTDPIKISLRSMFRQLVEDIRLGKDAAGMSARFHNTVAEALVSLAKVTRDRTKLDMVALSGGVFCNRYLTDRLIQRLIKEGFLVLWNRSVPANDGGIAVGQAAIAAHV